jgi:hypothetical protein
MKQPSSHGNKTTCNNRRTVVNGVFYAVCTKGLSMGQVWWGSTPRLTDWLTDRPSVAMWLWFDKNSELQKSLRREHLVGAVRVVGYSPDSKKVWAEAEESSLLKPLPGDDWWRHSRMKNLSCVVVICKAWRPAVALSLSVVTSRVLKWSIIIQSPIQKRQLSTPSRDNIFTIWVLPASQKRPCAPWTW